MRTPEEKFSYHYHSLDRVEFVRWLPCAACHQRRGCHNAHTEGEGTSRKGHYTTIIPLCPAHHDEQHRIGVKSFAAKYNIDYAAEAALTQEKWLKHTPAEFDAAQPEDTRDE